MQLKTSWAETNLPNYTQKKSYMYPPLMNGYKCIDMRNDILHAVIITTCSRQYIFTIGVGPTEMVFSGITFLPPWQLTRESLHAVWHGTNQLVHNNHLTEAEASTSLAILFGWIVSTFLFLSKPQLSHQRTFI